MNLSVIAPSVLQRGYHRPEHTLTLRGTVRAGAAFGLAFGAALTLGLALPSALDARQPSADEASATGYSVEACGACVQWNAPQEPFRIFGSTFWVGTRGLGAILVSSDEGHVLIDGGLPGSAPAILANIERLGFDVHDIRVILNSHAHFDHAGGIAALQAASRARVLAMEGSVSALVTGRSVPGDPQFEVALPFPGAQEVRVLSPGDTVQVGPLALVPHLTAGHTPGGTTWSWRSCEGETCLDLVYADSLTPVSADGFLYTSNPDYPDAISDFQRGFAALEAMPCDILLTPHPDASGLWERVAERSAGDVDALVDRGACAAYAARGREALAARIARETGL